MNRKDLKIGSVYQCKLSGGNMIIQSVEGAMTSDNKPTLIVLARYFNTTTGQYESINVIDGQLQELSTVNMGAPYWHCYNSINSQTNE